MEVRRYKLEFPAGFHLAPHELEYDSSVLTIPSDTLFPALLAAWIRLGDSAEAWLEPFVRGDPPFLISSAFPCIGDELWFPRPLDFKPDREWKKVAWVREEEFLAITCGQTPRRESSGEEKWEVAEVPRVTLDRLSNRSNFFSFGRTYFQKGCGLWFAVAWRKPAETCGNIPFSKAFEQALAELSLTGLGGDRSVGYGRFTWEVIGECSWPDPVPGGFGVLLSRCYPRPEELDLLRLARAWKLVEVGGWAETAKGHVRRKRVVLIAEGAVVPSAVMGGLVDLRPPEFAAHPIWRYGFVFLYPREVRHAH